jgi:hypothetical protein
LRRIAGDLCNDLCRLSDETFLTDTIEGAAAVETDEEIRITRPAPNRVCIKADSVRMQEIADYGQPGEHPYAEARRPGYVWRAVIVQRLEQRDGGVYVELETVSLSRGIPIEVRWLIKPLTDDLPRKMMTDMLNATRAAVQQQAKVNPVNKLGSAGGDN